MSKPRVIKCREHEILDSYRGQRDSARFTVKRMDERIDDFWRYLWKLKGEKEVNIPITEFEILLREATHLKDILKRQNIVTDDLHDRGKRYLQTMYVNRRKKRKPSDVLGHNMQKARKISL